MKKTKFISLMTSVSSKGSKGYEGIAAYKVRIPTDSRWWKVKKLSTLGFIEHKITTDYQNQPKYSIFHEESASFLISYINLFEPLFYSKHTDVAS